MRSLYFSIWLYELILYIGLSVFFLVTGFSVVRWLILWLISISMLFNLRGYLKKSEEN